MTTSFEEMSHEQMIAWLDQANSAAVQSVADRLASAATAINKVAEELKVRPQVVAWKGQGAESFRTWAADLANATLRLGDYSKGASTQLGHAADAIALAKAAAPRPKAGAQSNLDAALAAPNDPDSSALVKKLTGEMETERIAAAKELKKLSEAYSHSADGIGGLKKPTFPPPPQVIAPEDTGGRVSGDYIAGGETAGRSAGTQPGGVGASDGGRQSVSAPSASSSSHAAVTAPVGSTVHPPVSSAVLPPVATEIDSVATLPTAPPDTAVGPSAPAASNKPDGLLTTPAVSPPNVRSGLTVPPATTGGKATATTRPPLASGPGNSGVNPVGRPSRDGGIVGGRPAAQMTGRPAGGLPRGTVIGGEAAHAGRAPMGHGAGVGGAGGGSQSGIVGGRRLAGEPGGVVAGRPQQPGRAAAASRPFTPGGTGLVRGAAAGGEGRAAGQAGRGALAPQRSRDPRRDEGERPDYLVEDEETWQQGGRRVVPPVID
ncbi:hypothetical protein ABZ371_08540 [Streptomyces sp. NPDC005899]|uniref:WXG100 family type VII secretion target n=1 Tax=Streptomyces sp. NPDC005899 TaxID=3155716 RepID=UPI0033D4A9FE